MSLDLRAKTMSLGHYALMAFIVVVLGAIATGFVLHRTQDQVIEELQLQGKERLELYASTLQSAVARYEYLPYLIATDHEVLGLLEKGASISSGDQQKANDKLLSWQQASGAAVLYVMSAKGRVLASSNVDTPHSFLGNDYHYRPYFKDAMLGGEGRFFAIGATTGVPGFFLSYPVFSGESIIGVAVVKLEITELEANWAAGGEGVMVTDRDGVVFLASDASWKYKGLELLSQATRQRLFAERKYSGKQIGKLNIRNQELGDRNRRVLVTYSDGLLLQPRALELLDGTLYYLASLKSLEEKSRNTILNGILATLLFGLLGSLWLMRVSSTRQARLASMKLARSSIEQRQIIRETQAGLVTTDESFRITFANPTAVEIFNSSLEQFEGTDLCSWLRQSGAEEAQRLCSTDVNFSKLLDAELEAVRPDGEAFSVLVSSRPLVKSGEKGFLVTINDVSELKAAEHALRQAHDELEHRVERRTKALNDEVRERAKAEEELRQTQKELIQAAKLAALGQMSAGIVHEINQPLAAIHTYLASARLLLERNEPKMADENLGEIQGLVRRMNTLISHLKSFASRSEGKLKPINLDNVIKNTLMLLKPRLQKTDIELVVNKPDRPICVLGDEIRLEQIMVNLLRNSMDAAPEIAGRVEVNINASDDDVVVAVLDNGSGIDEANMTRIFDPFFTTKEVGEGMGLGLSVSYGIAREMGGQLSVSNLDDGGACFKLKLMPAAMVEKEVL